MLLQILQILDNGENFVSGEFIASQLGVTRASVWKYILKLRSIGYEILSVNKKGYLLKKNKNLLNQFEVTKNLKTDFFGKKCIFFQSIHSTNTYALNLANKGADDGTLVIANHQSEGKGRFDREWVSQESFGIYMSIILKPNIDIIKSNQLTLIAGIAICRVMKKIDLETFIKWPNDILVKNKKVAGILTELSAEIEKVNYIVIGIGMNVNNKDFPKEIENKATSIFLELGEEYNRNLIIQEFLVEFENMYKKYIEFLDFTLFLDEYKKLCINLYKDVKIFYKNKDVLGKIIDITEFGQLIFLTNDNQKLTISSGEVSIRNVDGTYI